MNQPLHRLSAWVREYTEELFSWAYYKVSDDELANGKKVKKLACKGWNKYLPIIAMVWLLASCTKEEPAQPQSVQNSGSTSGWLVPLAELSIREGFHDMIRSNDNPLFISPAEASIDTSEEVFVYQADKEIRIYPVRTLGRHEIVNDQGDGEFFAVTYCPLTASGVAWDRTLNGHETTFGVSGNLYNNNLIPYDRKTGSYWSQMRLLGIKGSHAGNALQHRYLLQSTYSTAIKAFPNAVVLHDSLYSNQCDSICLPPDHTPGGSTWPPVNGYFGIIEDEEALLVDFDLFPDSIVLYQVSFNGKRILIAGSSHETFVTAFYKTGNTEFYPVNGKLPVIMRDSDGNEYDLMGNIVYGPKTGQRLDAPLAYSARKFAWELLHPVNKFFNP